MFPWEQRFPGARREVGSSLYPSNPNSGNMIHDATWRSLAVRELRDPSAPLPLAPFLGPPDSSSFFLFFLMIKQEDCNQGQLFNLNHGGVSLQLP